MAKPSGEPGWTWRRLIIFPVVIWACYQLAVLIDARDTALNETIAWGWQVLIMVLVLGFTGFATVQDVIAIWRTRSSLPYREPDHDRRDRHGDGHRHLPDEERFG